MLKSLAIVLMLVSQAVFAGDLGDRESRPYIQCEGVSVEGHNINVDIRLWNFPTQLTGTVRVNKIAEPIGIQFSSTTISAKQSFPRSFKVAMNIARSHSTDRHLNGVIAIQSLSSSKTITADLACLIQ